MPDTLPWQFEPCDPDGACGVAHIPWGHAVRGRREGGRSVMGFGRTPPLAEQDARQEAQRFDAREVLGTSHVCTALPVALPTQTMLDDTEVIRDVIDRMMRKELGITE